MHVIDLRPRGYCHGVLNALAIVKKVLKTPSYPRPIYVLGQIVHNKKITEAFNALGVISLDQPGKTRMELLDGVESGTVIFTAHGIADSVIEAAKARGLTYLNATCRDVYKVHHAVKKKLSEGYKVIYIGHRNHPEPEAILDISSDIYFVEDEKDVLMLPLHLANEKLFVTNQTTLSLYDIKALLEVLSTKFPNHEFDNEICSATTVRQEAVMHQEASDLLLVVGDEKSSNSQKLSHVSKVYKGIPSHLIGGIEDIDVRWLKDIKTVSVTSGASTPTSVTEEVISFLKNYDETNPDTWDTTTKLTPMDIL